METRQTWDGHQASERKKSLDSAPISTKYSSFLLHPASGKGSDHIPTRPVWHAVDIFSVFGGVGGGRTDLGRFWKRPYLIACGAIDSHDPLITSMGSMMVMMARAYLRLMSYLLR